MSTLFYFVCLLLLSVHITKHRFHVALIVNTVSSSHKDQLSFLYFFYDLIPEVCAVKENEINDYGYFGGKIKKKRKIYHHYLDSSVVVVVVVDDVVEMFEVN